MLRLRWEIFLISVKRLVLVMLLLLLKISVSSPSECLMRWSSSRRWETIHVTTSATAIHLPKSSCSVGKTSSRPRTHHRIHLSATTPSPSPTRKSGIAPLIIHDELFCQWVRWLLWCTSIDRNKYVPVSGSRLILQ